MALAVPAWQGKPGPTWEKFTAGTFLKKPETVLASTDKCLTEKFPREAVLLLLPGLMKVINKSGFCGFCLQI